MLQLAPGRVDHKGEEEHPSAVGVMLELLCQALCATRIETPDVDLVHVPADLDLSVVLLDL